jgi:hypothetical protein
MYDVFMNHFHGAKLIGQPDKTGRNFLMPLVDGRRATRDRASQDVLNFLRSALRASGGSSPEARQIDEKITQEWREAVEAGEMYALGPDKFFAVFECDDTNCDAGRGRWLDRAIDEIRAAGFNLSIGSLKK